MFVKVPSYKHVSKDLIPIPIRMKQRVNSYLNTIKIHT